VATLLRRVLCLRAEDAVDEAFDAGIHPHAPAHAVRQRDRAIAAVPVVAQLCDLPDLCIPSDLGPLASDLGRRTSDVGPRTSNLGRRTSAVGPRPSNLGRRTSDVGPRTSVLDLPTRARAAVPLPLRADAR